MNNAERAERAGRAVEAYWGSDGPEDLATQVGDLIGDLLHLIDHDIDPQLAPVAVLARGLNHYLAEVHPLSLTEGDRGEDSVMDPLPDDIEAAIATIRAYLLGD